MHTLWNLLGSPFVLLANLPRAILRLSLAARITLVVTVFLIVVVLFGLAMRIADGGDPFAGRHVTLGLVLLLLAITPPFVYMAAKMWLEQEVPRWTDIHEAWREALAGLARQGISLTETPLFLVVGATGDDEEERLLARAQFKFVVHAAPAGDAALHVYGGPDAVFLCIATASHTSDAARNGAIGRGGGAAGYGLPTPNPASPVELTINLASLPPAGPDPAPKPTPPGPAVTHGGVRATIHLDSVAPAAGAVAAVRAGPSSSLDRERLDDRLRYLCDLVRRERRGIAPINGVLGLVPWRVLAGVSDEASAFGRALGDDLAGMTSALGLRAPVTLLVTGLEAEPGFLEFVRRMPAAGLDARIGQRFPVGVPPTHDELGRVASRSLGAIEDLINGRILRQPGVIQQAENASLIALVSRLRGEIARNLAVIMRRGLDFSGRADGTPPLFAGCYVAATGSGDGQSAFARGVFDKVFDGQGDLEWTRAAVAENERAERLSRGLWIASGVAFALVAVLLGYRALNRTVDVVASGDGVPLRSRQ